MAIKITSTKLHWNYFLALEQDLEQISRYIEFCEGNFEVFSIELAHLLFAAASEVDVLAKCISEIIDPQRNHRNIDDYRKLFVNSAALPREDIAHISDVSKMVVLVSRYGMKLTPWDHWGENKNPDWWRSYNNVKHKRHEHFNEATLKNALNAMGALLIMNYHYYRLLVTARYRPEHRYQFQRGTVTRHLTPESTLLRLPQDYYDSLNSQLGLLVAGFSDQDPSSQVD